MVMNLRYSGTEENLLVSMRGIYRTKALSSFVDIGSVWNLKKSSFLQWKQTLCNFIKYGTLECMAISFQTLFVGHFVNDILLLRICVLFVKI